MSVARPGSRRASTAPAASPRRSPSPPRSPRSTSRDGRYAAARSAPARAGPVVGHGGAHICRSRGERKPVGSGPPQDAERFPNITAPPLTGCHRLSSQPIPGQLAQRESTRLTREGSLVRSQYCPSEKRLGQGVLTYKRGDLPGLRVHLREAYGFSVFGAIALWAAIASFILAILVALGFWHARRTPEDADLLGPS